MNDELKEAVSKAKSPEWYLEIVGRILDEGADIDHAIKIADRYVEVHPYAPETDSEIANTYVAEQQAIDSIVKQKPKNTREAIDIHMKKSIEPAMSAVDQSTGGAYVPEDDGGETPEPHGAKCLRDLHKCLCYGKDLIDSETPKLDNDKIKSFMEKCYKDLHAGCGKIAAHFSKCYKDLEPIPHEDDEEDKDLDSEREEEETEAVDEKETENDEPTEVEDPEEPDEEEEEAEPVKTFIVAKHEEPLVAAALKKIQRKLENTERKIYGVIGR